MEPRTLGDDVYTALETGVQSLEPTEGRILNGFKRFLTWRSFDTRDGPWPSLAQHLITAYASLYEAGRPELFERFVTATRADPKTLEQSLALWQNGYAERIGFDVTRDGAFGSLIEAHFAHDGSDSETHTDLYRALETGLERLEVTDRRVTRWFAMRIAARTLDKRSGTATQRGQHIALGYAALREAGARERFEEFLDAMLTGNRTVGRLDDLLASAYTERIGLDRSDVQDLRSRIEAYLDRREGTTQDRIGEPTLTTIEQREPARASEHNGATSPIDDDPITSLYAALETGLERLGIPNGPGRFWFAKRIHERSFGEQYSPSTIPRHVALGYATLRAAGASDRFDEFMHEILGSRRAVGKLEALLTTAQPEVLGLDADETSTVLERVNAYLERNPRERPKPRRNATRQGPVSVPSGSTKRPRPRYKDGHVMSGAAISLSERVRQGLPKDIDANERLYTAITEGIALLEPTEREQVARLAEHVRERKLTKRGQEPGSLGRQLFVAYHALAQVGETALFGDALALAGASTIVTSSIRYHRDAGYAARIGSDADDRDLEQTLRAYEDALPPYPSVIQARERRAALDRKTEAREPEQDEALVHLTLRQILSIAAERGHASRRLLGHALEYYLLGGYSPNSSALSQPKPLWDREALASAVADELGTSKESSKVQLDALIDGFWKDEYMYAVLTVTGIPENHRFTRLLAQVDTT